MTDVVDSLRPGFDFLCHCEERSDAAIRTLGSWSLSALPAQGTDCHGPAALAMTDVVDGLRPGFDFPCHCEERSDVAIRSFCSWSWSALPARGTDCRGPAALAMTEVVDDLRLGFDFLCHCHGFCEASQ